MRIFINKTSKGYYKIRVNKSDVHDNMSIDGVKGWLNNQLNDGVKTIMIETD